MSGMVNTIVKNQFEVDLNFHPIRVICFRNSDPVLNVRSEYDEVYLRKHLIPFSCNAKKFSAHFL